jgi:hypothetical protein
MRETVNSFAFSNFLSRYELIQRAMCKASCRSTLQTPAPNDHLVPERQPIRGRHIARQIVVREAEYKKLVRIRDGWHIRGL